MVAVLSGPDHALLKRELRKVCRRVHAAGCRCTPKGPYRAAIDLPERIHHLPHVADQLWLIEPWGHTLVCATSHEADCPWMVRVVAAELIGRAFVMTSSVGPCTVLEATS